MEWIKNYLKSGTAQSSMRLVMIWAMSLISVIFLAISIYLIIMAQKNGVIDWIGVAGVIASLGIFIAPFLYFKKEQSKIEK